MAHANARLGPAGRRRLVHLMCELGHPERRAAERLGVSRADGASLEAALAERFRGSAGERLLGSWSGGIRHRTSASVDCRRLRLTKSTLRGDRVELRALWTLKSTRSPGRAVPRFPTQPPLTFVRCTRSRPARGASAGCGARWAEARQAASGRCGAAGAGRTTGTSGRRRSSSPKCWRRMPRPSTSR